MLINKVSNLACPIDGEQLHYQTQQLICKNNHTFDIARQGYVNLLPVQYKRSKEPGDSKEMVVARTQFLNAGFYTPVANKAVEIIRMLISDTKEICLLDAGCGEGYYLDHIANELERNPGQSMVSLIGLDISKHAILAAAKRNKKITWLVGTNRQLPVCKGSVDIILCVFGFHSFEGFSHALKTGGKIILVEPGPDHLKELRQVIYTDVNKDESQGASYDDQQGFSLVNKVSLHFQTAALEQAQIRDLLLMTPHFYRASKEGKEAASYLDKLSITVDMVFNVLEKSA